MFANGSRYKNMATYEVTDAKGRTVRAVVTPLPTRPSLAGEYVLLEGERLDHLTSRFLGDATAFWRICDANNVMHPDELVMVGRPVLIPVREI
jgi:hypothetical protein